MLRIITLLVYFHSIYAQPPTPKGRILMEGLHNFIRSIAVPEAANMLALQYNISMEPLAEAFAKGCLTQNIAGLNTYLALGLPDIDFLSAISSWQKEKLFFSNDLNRCIHYNKCQNYKNMIWAGSKSFACAVVDCTKRYWFKSTYTFLYACVYYPRADFQAERSYDSSPSCSKCPPGTTCKGYLCYPNHR